MKLSILLEALNVKKLTDNIRQIIITCLEKADQTPQGPAYAVNHKKIFWNTLKAMCRIEMEVDIRLTDKDVGTAHTNPLTPLVIYIRRDIIERFARYVISNKANREYAVTYLLSMIIHEITHLNQFSNIKDLRKANYYDSGKSHFARHMEIEANCNALWPKISKYLLKDGELWFDAKIIHRCLVNFFDYQYDVDFEGIPDNVKKQYYLKLYKVLQNTKGKLPQHKLQINDVVVVYSDPIEETPSHLAPYIITDIDGYKITVVLAKYNIKTSEYEPIGLTKKFVNRMFVAPYTFRSTDMFHVYD